MPTAFSENDVKPPEKRGGKRKKEEKKKTAAKPVTDKTKGLGFSVPHRLFSEHAAGPLVRRLLEVLRFENMPSVWVHIRPES